MKSLVVTILLFQILLFAQPSPDFNKFFIDQSMRIDYFHIGNMNEELISIDRIYGYGTWAGSLINLIDNLNNGKYYHKIYDASTNKLIYSKGFDTFFGEYASSRDGRDGVRRSFHESAIIPYPKNKIIFAMEKREESNEMTEIFRTEIDPASIYIIKDKITGSGVEIFKPVFNGNPHNKVDIAILAEGYTKNEKDKFIKDLNRFVEYFFEDEPYKSHRSDFSFYGVFKPSEESGTDLPGADIFVNTVLNTSFWTLGSERYLMTEDNKSMRDLAAHVPYDAIYIQVNHPRYGGGGIYNQYCITQPITSLRSIFLFTNSGIHSSDSQMNIILLTYLIQIFINQQLNQSSQT